MTKTYTGLGYKIDEISMIKLVAAAFTTKIDTTAVVGPPCLRKTTFFVNLGLPGGPQNRDNWSHFCQKSVRWCPLVPPHLPFVKAFLAIPKIFDILFT